ncbi:hypothetical protein PRIC1_001479 [Phytophthora ramorum]
MALLARTFRTVVGLPWSTFELVDRAMRWSAMPVMPEEPTSAIWAQDLFAPCSSKSCSYDDTTDSSGSELCDDEDDDEEEWSSSESEEELDGFSFEDDGDVEFWGDRWFWAPCQEDNELASEDVETTSYVMERLVDYVMPSMELDPDARVDSWVDKYGSSRPQIRFVTVPLSERTPMYNSSVFLLPSNSTGLFVAVL